MVKLKPIIFKSNSIKPYVFWLPHPHFFKLLYFIQSLSFDILLLSNLYSFWLVWNLKFNSTLLSWIVLNSDDITQVPDQTDCIQNMKAKSIRACFDTFYLRVKPTVRFDLNLLSANITKWSNTLIQLVGNLATNFLRVFDHFVGLAP